MTIPQVIIQYLEDNGEQPKGRIEDYLRNTKRTTGGCVDRRLREMTKAQTIIKGQKEHDSKFYTTYRIAPQVQSLTRLAEAIAQEPYKITMELRGNKIVVESNEAPLKEVPLNI